MSRAHGILVVTGAASGMGEAAVRLAVGKYSVIVAIDRDASAVRGLASYSTSKTSIDHVVCDVTSKAGIGKASEHVAREHGSVNGLLNFAGVSDFGPAIEIPAKTWARQLSVNLTGTFLACQAFGRQMIVSRSGAIVNVASTAGTFGVPGMVAYSAAKHGVVGLTRALAVEWAQFGVRVNCICPGATLTPMLLSTTEEFRAARSRRIPLGRFGLPEEQAAVALFLVSSAAAYVTGAVLPVDGGIAAMAPGTSEAALRSPA